MSTVTIAPTPILASAPPFVTQPVLASAPQMPLPAPSLVSQSISATPNALPAPVSYVPVTQAATYPIHSDASYGNLIHHGKNKAGWLSWRNIMIAMIVVVTFICIIYWYIRPKRKTPVDPVITAELSTLTDQQVSILKQIQDMKVDFTSKTNAVNNDVASLQTSFLDRINTIQNHDSAVSQQLSSLLDKNLIIQEEMKDLIDSGKVLESGQIQFDLTQTKDVTQPTSEGPVLQSTHVNFKKTYRSPPTVLLSLMGVNSGSVKTRFTLSPVNITTSGFDVQLIHWWDTNLGGVTANYIAMPV